MKQVRGKQNYKADCFSMPLLFIISSKFNIGSDKVGAIQCRGSEAGVEAQKKKKKERAEQMGAR